MTFVYPKSLQNDLKRLQNAYSTSSSHASTVLLVLHDYLCKMMIAAPPSIGFFRLLGPCTKGSLSVGETSDVDFSKFFDQF